MSNNRPTTTIPAGATGANGVWDIIVDGTKTPSGFTEFRNSTLEMPGKKAKSASHTALERAVYGHIQAVRAIGRTTVNTNDIARALGVSVADVEVAVAGLRSKGIKAIGP